MILETIYSYGAAGRDVGSSTICHSPRESVPRSTVTILPSLTDTDHLQVHCVLHQQSQVHGSYFVPSSDRRSCLRCLGHQLAERRNLASGTAERPHTGHQGDRKKTLEPSQVLLQAPLELAVRV